MEVCGKNFENKIVGEDAERTGRRGPPLLLEVVVLVFPSTLESENTEYFPFELLLLILVLLLFPLLLLLLLVFLSVLLFIEVEEEEEEEEEKIIY